MEDRVKLRPTIQTVNITRSMSDEELFQNSVLRPIIKMQHGLLMLYLKNYLATKNVKLVDRTTHEIIQFIELTFQKDIQFKNELKGMIVGHFTLEEYQSYTEMISDLNKRILTMLKERMLNSIDELFVQPSY